MILPRALIFSAVLVSILPAARTPWAADSGSAITEARGRAAEVVAVLQEYRATLQRLLPLQERELAAAIKRRDERRHLLENDIISRKEFEETLHPGATVGYRITEGGATLAYLPDHEPYLGGRLADDTSWVSGFAVAERATVLMHDAQYSEEEYLAHFGRSLPISSYGQTPLHDRMGLDHRGALDVAVHPDSPEGRALMDYLRAAGIPFIAAWTAVPGATSGAHIHVGQPSPRIAIKR